LSSNKQLIASNVIAQPNILKNRLVAFSVEIRTSLQGGKQITKSYVAASMLNRK